MKATLTELRRKTKDIMRAVERGEPVILYRRGKAKARIVPVSSNPGMKMEDHPMCGMWKDREDMKDPVEWVRKLRSKQRFPELFAR
jgi:prevent-host-death family protein